MALSRHATAWAVFRHRDFALLCAGRFLALMALQMQNVAVGWLVYARTGDPFALGLIGLVAFLPVVGLALVTGHVADRVDRRLILICAYGTATAVAAGLVLVAAGPPSVVWPIFTLVLLMGVARAFLNPATQALVPNLVPADEFAKAVALNSSIGQVAVIIGPALGGLLYALGGFVVFATVAVLQLLALLAAFSLRYRAAARPRERTSWTTLVAGFVYIRQHRVILGAISLDMFAVLFGGAVALLPIFASDILAVGPLGLGVLRSMPAVGAGSMAILLAYFPLRRAAGKKMLLAVVIFGLATIVFGLSQQLWLSLAALIVMGAADMVSVVVRQTLVQLETPDAVRGRVAAVNSVFIGASNELGEFESGTLAALIGVVPAVVVGGVTTCGLALGWARLFPELRDRDRLVS